MNIKFLGTGGVFDYEQGNSSALVVVKNNHILVDCGPLVYPTLARNNLPSKITHILLTHLHGDHVGGLFQLILHLNSKANPKRKASIAYPTELFKSEIEAFLRFWFPRPGDYVDFIPLAEINGVGAIDTTDKHTIGITSFSYFFFEDDSLIYFSGDIGEISVAATFLKTRTEKNIVVFHEMHHLKGSAHVHYQDLMRGLSAYRVYGYHCDPEKIPPDNSIPLVADTPDLLFR